jgi:hypothetical protein
MRVIAPVKRNLWATEGQALGIAQNAPNAFLLHVQRLQVPPRRLRFHMRMLVQPLLCFCAHGGHVHHRPCVVTQLKMVHALGASALSQLLCLNSVCISHFRLP